MKQGKTNKKLQFNVRRIHFQVYSLHNNPARIEHGAEVVEGALPKATMI